MSDSKQKSARINVSLAGLEVGLSGAIPERKDWTEPAMDRGILEFVALFSGLVFKYGGRIVHGCHPSLTPVILHQARLHAKKTDKPPVTLVMSDLWISEYRYDEIQSMLEVSELIVTKRQGSGTAADVATRNNSLTSMRKVLIAAQNMMIAVGGKKHDADGINPGIAEEMNLAHNYRIPRYLIGGLGGYSQELAKSLAIESLHNDLSRDDNIELFNTNDVSSCVNLIFENLCQRCWKFDSINLPSNNLQSVHELIKEKLIRDKKPNSSPHLRF
ncbi:hypothetical protein [Pectobacterium fontis]|uniref:Uncharacterized protein n=1 Tax=Pectobacterium fontis TaxID=2558042 RepID=A0A7V8L705_9GAMM|nr:hypothetical protein [Pectobacterium fontis]KHN56273.1 hypothetical protein OI69_01540 [Pectobacterium fontis]